MILSIKISYFRMCFRTFELSCSILEKDNFVEHLYIVLSCVINRVINRVCFDLV